MSDPNVPLQLFLHETFGKVVDVSPDLACKLLATSPGNRNLRQTAVSRYAGAMRRGEWMVAQPLIVDSNGQLRDGHHRLHAVVDCGITTPFLLVTGVSPDAYRVMDVGITRTMTDLVPFGRRQIEEATMLLSLVSGRGLRPTAHQMETLCNKPWRAASEALAENSPTHRRIFSTTPVRVAALCHMVDHPAPPTDDIVYVFNQYRACTLAAFDVMSPRVRAFYRQGLTIPSGGGGTARNELLARAYKAFDPSEAEKDSLHLGPKNIGSVIEKLRADIPKRFDIHPEGT